ncbi:forkhead box protein Q1 [Trichomycterus rosablanca]|uniref:forkhead box protein Q1 n=1 Tax=Trichomycterus rosablanca TaxID=2290929 RepID=UPI002F35A2CF
MSQNFDPKPAETTVVHGRKYKRHTRGTYVGLIAYVIQDSPNKMLTFKQIMERLGVFVTGDRKGLENNIRVCLSSNKCFVKEPVDPEYPNAKRNFWKVDESSITPKMLRRHFRDIAKMFPGLPAKLENSTGIDTAKDPALPVCTDEKGPSSIKFSSPFSIESLLKKDHSTHKRIPSVQDTVQYAVLAKGVQNGCVLSPLLLTLQSTVRTTIINVIIDMTMVGLISRNNNFQIVRPYSG